MLTYGLCADVALKDAGNQRRLLERQVLRRFREVEVRRGLHAVGAVAEIHLVAVHREDLFLRVPLLDLDREDRFLDFARPPFSSLRKSLRVSCCVSVLAPAAFRRSDQVLDGGQDDVGNAQAEVLKKVIVLGSEDRRCAGSGKCPGT